MISKIMGIEFPMAYTVEAEILLEKQFGGSIDKKKIEEIFDTTVYENLVNNVSFVASVLIEAGKKREVIRGHITRQEVKSLPSISYEDLRVCIQPGEIVVLMKNCIMAINQGNRINIEVVPEKSKKKDSTKLK